MTDYRVERRKSCWEIDLAIKVADDPLFLRRQVTA